LAKREPGLRLILMRHGEAGQGASSDFERVLTPAGADDVARTSATLTDKSTLTHIITSPFLRARQTADIVAERFGIPSAVSTWKEISPDGRVEVVMARLGGEAGVPLVVTHQPLIGKLVAYLTGVDLRVETSMAVGIGWENSDEKSGELEWVVRS